MTWNVRGGKLKRIGKKLVPQACKPNPDPDYLNGIAIEIREHAWLDVVALQEVYWSQVVELKKKLFPHLGSDPSVYFVGTINCDRIDDKFGIAIISRHRFSEGSRKRVPLCNPSGKPTLVERPFTTLIPPPRCPAPNNEPRVLARVIITVRGRPIHIYNTHLPPGEGLHSGMTAVIFRQIKDDQPDRAVLLGDFYASPGSTGYSKLTAGKFRDAWLGAGRDRKDCDAKDMGFTHPSLKPTVRADYVFIGTGFRVADGRLTCAEKLLGALKLTRKSHDAELKVPDHLPLTVRLALVDTRGK
jgi:endonuclease/exonuclease/phosphatase family metal-dependent hydrolase